MHWTAYLYIVAVLAVGGFYVLKWTLEFLGTLIDIDKSDYGEE